MALTPYFLGLDPMVQYDLMTAMRGPDSHALELLAIKAAVTARIRSIVMTTFERSVALYCDIPMQAKEWDQMVSSTNSLKVDSADIVHYLGHVRNAVLVSRDHVVWGGFAESIGAHIFSLMMRTK